jgi:hypothetical protein
MFNLDIPTNPFWIDFANLGVRIEVMPLDGVRAAVARSRAVARANKLRAEQAERRDAGVEIDGPDMAEPEIWLGRVNLEMAAVLSAGIIAWEGVGDAADQPVPLSAANAERFARHPTIADQFVARYFGSLERVTAEGNAFAPLPNGGSGQGANSATDAAPNAPTAPARSTNRKASRAAPSGKRQSRL